MVDSVNILLKRENAGCIDEATTGKICVLTKSMMFLKCFASSCSNITIAFQVDFGSERKKEGVRREN